MKKVIEYPIHIILLLAIALTMSGCERDDGTEKLMNMAENLMDAKPDSALTILEDIPASTVRGKDAQARYALLKSMALDKNGIDTTTFDVLQSAIEYYVKNGTPDELLRTYYYQGRIYQNQGDDDAAMRSFMNACDLRQEVSDTLMLAHALVAQGTLYLKQYKTSEYIQNNLEAAELYSAIGKDIFEIKSYTNAIDGYVMTNDQSSADSLLSVCVPLAKKCPDGEAYMFHSVLSYTVEFGSPKDIKTFLDCNQDLELTADETIDFVQGYSKIGEYDKAMALFLKVNPAESLLDSIKYEAVKIEIMENQGKYKQALDLYKGYSAMLERYQKDLLSHALLFSDKKHKIEMESLMEIQDRDRIIWGTLCGVFCLCLLVGWLYYRGRQHKLEAANLRLEISQLENERERLKDLQQEQAELSQPIQEAIKTRLDMLNALLAKEITNNDSYAAPYHKWIEAASKDKRKFMDSTRLAFEGSHPQFMSYLEQHGLSTDEINYLCLYAIGLRGKEVGEYIQLKRHYVISHEIRQKLGIDEHETNIGLYVRRLMKDLAK